MVKYIYSLVFLTAVSSGAFAMEVRQDLQKKTYDELRELERQNTQREEAFNAQYPNGEWRNDTSIASQRDAINNEGRALRNAIMMNAPRHLIKPHCVTNDQQVNDDGNVSVCNGITKYCRSFDEVHKGSYEVAVRARKIKIQENPHAQLVAKVFSAYDELWNALCASANGKKGQELACIAEKMDFVQDQQIALSDRFKKE